MRLTFFLVAMSWTVLFSSTGLAEESEKIAVVVSFHNGDQLKGTVTLKSFILKSDLGNLDVNIEKIDIIEFFDPRSQRLQFNNQARIHTRSGSMITGEAELETLKLDTEFGALTTPLSKVKLIQFDASSSGSQKRGAPNEPKSDGNPESKKAPGEKPATADPTARPKLIPPFLLAPGRLSRVIAPPVRRPPPPIYRSQGQ